MLRQALAESQAWTPMPSPWTLPAGLASLTALGRPLSRSTSWLAASDRASPIASGAIPSARAAATASAACSGVEPKMVWLILSTQASSAAFVPAALPMSLYWSSSFGSTTPAAGRVRGCWPPPPNAFLTQ